MKSSRFIFFILFLILIPSSKNFAGIEPQNIFNQLCFRDACFRLERAETPRARQKGLMNRSSLDGDSAMLFIFDEDGRYPIWMKNMRFPLDILWLDKDFRVIDMAEAVPPCIHASCESIIPTAPARYVLETLSGTIAQSEIHKGDSAVFVHAITSS